MKNKIKGLLALVLSVLIGQAWAADPVATWTDFNTLTSGNYTITKDAACTVNADGSITLGGAGLSVTMPGNVENITVVMDVSTLPASGPYTIVNLPVTSHPYPTFSGVIYPSFQKSPIKPYENLFSHPFFFVVDFFI